MKFSTKEDMEMPIADAFALFSDFDQFERSALRRGVDVKRTDSLFKRSVGMKWASSFKFRGKQRNVVAELIGYTPPESYEIELQSNDLAGYGTLELMALSKSRTRATMTIEMKAKSLSGRLMIQTMRFGKSRLDKRFHKKAAEFVKVIEREHHSNRRI